MKDRVSNFKMKNTSVVELDMTTKFVFSDPDNNIVRIMHVGRRKNRRVIFFSKAYLDGLKIRKDNDSDMRELAMWINYGQRFLDLEDLAEKGVGPDKIQELRAKYTREFFESREDGSGLGRKNDGEDAKRGGIFLITETLLRWMESFYLCSIS